MRFSDGSHRGMFCLMTTYLIKSLSSRIRRFATIACAGVLLGLSAFGCGSVKEEELTLAEQTLHYDMKVNLTIPPGMNMKITCDNTFGIQCSTLPALLGLTSTYQVTGLCDQSTNLCVGDIKQLILFVVDFSKDTAFTTGFAQSNADNMRDVNLYYTATSGVDIDITKIDAYIGPNGIRSISDPSAVYLGTVGPLPKKGSINDAGNPLFVADGSPGHKVFIDAVRDPSKPLNILLSVTARYVSGDPVPAPGPIDVKLKPVVKMLKR